MSCFLMNVANAADETPGSPPDRMVLARLFPKRLRSEAKSDGFMLHRPPLIAHAKNEMQRNQMVLGCVPEHNAWLENSMTVLRQVQMLQGAYQELHKIKSRQKRSWTR